MNKKKLQDHRNNPYRFYPYFTAIVIKTCLFGCGCGGGSSQYSKTHKSQIVKAEAPITTNNNTDNKNSIHQESPSNKTTHPDHSYHFQVSFRIPTALQDEYKRYLSIQKIVLETSSGLIEDASEHLILISEPSTTNISISTLDYKTESSLNIKKIHLYIHDVVVESNMGRVYQNNLNSESKTISMDVNYTAYQEKLNSILLEFNEGFVSYNNHAIQIHHEYLSSPICINTSYHLIDLIDLGLKESFSTDTNNIPPKYFYFNESGFGWLTSLNKDATGKMILGNIQYDTAVVDAEKFLIKMNDAPAKSSENICYGSFKPLDLNKQSYQGKLFTLPTNRQVLSLDGFIYDPNDNLYFKVQHQGKSLFYTLEDLYKLLFDPNHIPDNSTTNSRIENVSIKSTPLQ